MQTKQNRTGREQRNNYRPRTETGTPSNHFQSDTPAAGGLIFVHVTSINPSLPFPFTQPYIRSTSVGLACRLRLSTSPLDKRPPPHILSIHIRSTLHVPFSTRHMHSASHLVNPRIFQVRIFSISHAVNFVFTRPDIHQHHILPTWHGLPNLAR
jgi:hypothetical protein